MAEKREHRMSMMDLQVSPLQSVKVQTRVIVERICESFPALLVVLQIFILSRLVFYVAGFFGIWLVPETGAWTGRVTINSHPALAMHWRWDAIHYYSIAIGGYSPSPVAVPPTQSDPHGLPAFFPLLPLLLRITATLLDGLRTPALLPITTGAPWPLLAGVLVAHGTTLLAFWLLFRLACEETGDTATAQRTVLYTAIFPLAFYYAVPYTEALFLATSVGAFLAARRGHWIRSGLWVAAASATRLVGVLLVPVLAVEIILAWRRGELRARVWAHALLGLLLAPLGLLLFMLHLWQQTGTPLAFITAQANWNRAQMFPLMTLWRALGYALRPAESVMPDTYALGVLQTLIVLGFLAVLVASLRQWRPTYVLYGLLLFTLYLSSPLSGQTLMQSQGRYAMVLFPVYITLARWGRRPVVHQAIMLLWLPLLGILTALYVCWYFVA